VQIERIESLIPRGMIFWGPPGTGKTLFAKAMATALGAAVTIVSGPELKSKWVGESEHNLRAVFMRARQSAPAVIVFDELDSFASARGRFDGGSGVEHSMVNQLLTEMDGFRKEELVFIVGTTNFVESLDQALMRPGRFEFVLHIPYPNAEDRRAILKVHDARLGTQLSAEALDYAVKRTDDLVPGPGGGTRYSAITCGRCRQLARTRLREDQRGPSVPADIQSAIERARSAQAAAEGSWSRRTEWPRGDRCRAATRRRSIGSASAATSGASATSARSRASLRRHRRSCALICTLFGGRGVGATTR
jgi:cell division protease FtsH